MAARKFIYNNRRHYNQLLSYELLTANCIRKLEMNTLHMS
jgi:hypothetical protein